jgi:argininosuccinate synthase
MWSVQQLKIQFLFESDNKGIVNWKKLWSDYMNWYTPVQKQKGIVLWSEQKRQIETLMLEQLKELNQEQFVLVYLYKGKPEMDTQKMTYWEALHTKKNLMGDKNGVGGDEDVEKVSIVNLKSLID